MRLLDIVSSKVDNTIKYVFLTSDELIVELSYINKEDGKDIICVPTQTACKMGCKFCHITSVADKLILRNLKDTEILDFVDYVFNDLKLRENKRTLLISYMGCGEPLLNANNVLNSMLLLSNKYDKKLVPYIRYGLATSLPANSKDTYLDFISKVAKHELPLKLHLSLHYTSNELRTQWMPNSMGIASSIALLSSYKNLTDNSVEIHYALIDGVNDRLEDAELLTKYLRGTDIPVKFLFYNENPTLEYHASSKKKLSDFKTLFDINNIHMEYYIPPGLDVGASCGQFLMDYYLKYNKA